MPHVQFVWNVDYYKWWNVHIDGEWLASFLDLESAVKYVYMVTGTEVWGESGSPHKKY